MPAAVMLGAAGALLTGAVTPPASASMTTAARWRVSYVSPSELSGITDLAAVSAHDVWAVGNVTPEGPLTARRPIVRRWNGHSWAVVRLPAKFSHAQLFAVAASSPTDAWVFGQWRNASGLDGHAFALRWTGSWSVAGFWKTYNLISGAVDFGPKDV